MKTSVNEPSFDFIKPMFLIFWSVPERTSLSQKQITQIQLGCTQEKQFVIFKPFSYCFEETIEFDVKFSFASRPVSRLIWWYNKRGDITKEFEKRLFSSMELFMDWKLQTVKGLDDKNLKLFCKFLPII